MMYDYSEQSKAYLAGSFDFCQAKMFTKTLIACIFIIIIIQKSEFFIDGFRNQIDEAFLW